MQYNIYINQLKASEWGLNLQQAALFSFLYELPSWAECHVIAGTSWYRIARSKLTKELPILTTKTDTIYRQMRGLTDAGLLEVTQLGAVTLVRITEKGASWNRDLGKISEGSEKNPSDPSEKNPTYHNTITNHITTPLSPQQGDDGGVVTAEGKIREYVLLAEKHGAAKNPAGLALHLQRQGGLNEFHLAQLAAWRQKEARKWQDCTKAKDNGDHPIVSVVPSHTWDEAKEKMRKTMQESEFKLWIDPLQCIFDDKEVIKLAAPDPYFCSWVTKNYLPQILKATVSREVRVLPVRH